MATRVAGPEYITEVQPADTVRYRDTGVTIIVNLGPNQLDGRRIAAHEAVCGNRQHETDAVMDIDQAAFDRVRGVEESMVMRAENLIADVERKGTQTVSPGLIESTEDIVTRLNALVTKLE